RSQGQHAPIRILKEGHPFFTARRSKRALIISKNELWGGIEFDAFLLQLRIRRMNVRNLEVQDSPAGRRVGGIIQQQTGFAGAEEREAGRIVFSDELHAQSVAVKVFRSD